jgi:hypothetical protein
MPTAQQTYRMLGNESLWDVARESHELLAERGVPHAIAEGVAVCLHGYQRNTVDLDLITRREDAAEIRAALEAAGFVWSHQQHEFRSPSGIAVQFLTAGDRAGTGSAVTFPDPADDRVVIEKEGLSVLTLPRLIESKIACGEGNLRRSHKDFADVVELIAIHKLTGRFAPRLHKSVRKTFRELLKHARGGP